MKMSLRKARAIAGLNQQEAGEAIGVTNCTISMWEKGHHLPNAVQFLKLCTLYNVNPNDIILEKE